MATGTQAAQIMLSKAASKEPTADNTCVQGLRTEVFGPLGIPVPDSDTISTFLVPPIKQVSSPFVGCIGRFPRALGYEHVCLITAVSGPTLQETSFGTAVGYVRSATYPAAFFESFWDPGYTGGATAVGDITSNASGGTSVFSALPQVLAIVGELSSVSFWKRFGLFALGGIILAIMLIKMTADSGAGKTLINAGKKAAEIAVIA